MKLSRRWRDGMPGLVAPHAGAWIETFPKALYLNNPPSPPMRGRGLKLSVNMDLYNRPFVAPHAGAWIETQYDMTFGHEVASPPMRGRGLKHPTRHL